MIKRFKDKEIKELLKQFPIVAIIGPRQCGKTTMAQMNVLNIKKTGLYYDLESPKSAILFEDAEHFLESLPDYVECVVIDEIQRKPELFAIFRSLIDRKKQAGKYVILGSASPDLVKGVSESLAGRIAYCEVAPFNLIEIYKKSSDLNSHWFKGGFPDAYLSKNDDYWYRWMDNFFRTFVERDLNTLFGITFSPTLMFKLWKMLAHCHGQIWNAQTIAKSLDISPTTVNKYIDYLEGAFLLRRLPAYYTNGKKRLIKSPKLYIRDAGLLHYLLDFSSQKEYIFNPAIGQSWEGYAIEQILQLLPSNIKAFYYRTHDGSEMDLVLVKGIKPLVSIELKTTNNPHISRGFYESKKDLNCALNYIITPEQMVSSSFKENVILCGLLDFLKVEINKILKLK